MNNQAQMSFSPEANTITSPLRNLRDRLTAPSSKLTDIAEQRAARLAASFLFIIFVFDIIGGIARAPRLGFNAAFAGSLGFSAVSTFVAYVLSRTKWYHTAVFIFSISFGGSAYSSIITQGAEANFSLLILIYVPLSLIVASSFLPSWSVFLLSVLNIVFMYATSADCLRHRLQTPARLAPRAAERLHPARCPTAVSTRSR